MHVRTFAAGLAFALFATLVAPAHLAQPLPKDPAIVLDTPSITPLEGSASGVTYKVALSTPPLGPVTVTIAVAEGASELLLSATSVTLDGTNWSAGVPVTVRVDGDDAVVEGTHVYHLAHTAKGTADTRFDSKTASLTVYAADNDAGVAVVQSLGTTSVLEDGAGDALTLSLGSQPSGNVVVKLRPSDSAQLSLSPFQWQFTPANWYVPVPVAVDAVHDDVAEGTTAGSISVTTTGGGAYGSVPAQTIPVTILDDDMVGLHFFDVAGNPLSGAPPVINPAAVAGAGSEVASASYGVALATRPSATVTVAVSVPSGQASVDKASLLFTTSDWNVAQTVTVTGAADRVDEGADADPILLSVVHDASSTDAAYGALPNQAATFRQFDDDTAGYLFGHGGTEGVIDATPTLAVSEAGTTWDTYTVRLSSKPASTFTMSFAGNDQITVAPASYTFGPLDWESAKTVNVTAKEDLVAENGQTAVAQSVNATGLLYKAIPAAVAVNVADNDSPGLDITYSGTLSVVEGGGPRTLLVKLKSQPTAVVTVAASAASDLGFDPSTVAFNGTNWMTVQKVNVTATDDAAREFTETVNAVLTPSGDANYGAAAAVTLPFQVFDNDGVAVIEEGPEGTIVQEHGLVDDSYTIRLVEAPTKDVSITVTAPTGLKVNGAQSVSLDFDAEVTLPAGNAPGLLGLLPDVIGTVDGVLDLVGLGPVDRDQVYETAGKHPWNAAYTIQVSADDDSAVTGSRTLSITHTLVTTDPKYKDASVRPVLAYVLDDDAGILVAQSDGTTAVAEGNPAGDTYTVRLATAPTKGVAIQVQHDGQVAVADGSPGFDGNLYFDPYFWDVDQTVIVTAVQDKADEANTMVSTIHNVVQTNDPVYGGKAAADVAVTVTDDDGPGITLTQTGGSTAVSESGTTDTYTLVLDAIPPTTVTIAISALTSGQVTVSPASISITPGTWNTPRTVTVTAVNDNVSEGPHSAVLHHTVTGWTGASVPDLTVSITDNDAAGLVVTSTGGAPDLVTENGAGDGFNVRLSSDPVSDVVVSVTSSDPLVTVWSPTLTFRASTPGNPGNWNTVQVAWFSVPNDATATGDRDATITFTVTGGDAKYLALAPVTRTLHIDDDDI
jgi:hypothetical protein